MGIFSTIKHKAGEAIHKHNMIESGDKILLGFSGGKDSLTLLDVMLHQQKSAPINFEIIVVIIDAGFGDYSEAEKYLKDKGVKYHIEKTKIAKVVEKETNKRGNYCFMCSRLRRGVIYKLAEEFDCNKVALGHNLDDAMETFMLNVMYSSKLEVLKPSYTTDDEKFIVIRPLIEVKEEDIIRYVEEMKVPIVKQVCPLKDEDSKRFMIKQFLKGNAKENKFLYSSMKNCMDELFRLKK